MHLFRYTRWDGTQNVDPFTAEDLMQHIAEDMLEDGDLRNTLRRMMQHGAEFSSGRRMMGLQDLLDRLRQARERNLDRFNLGSVFDDIQERLENLLKTEREGIQRRLDPNMAGADQPPSDPTSPNAENAAPATSDTEGKPGAEQSEAGTPRPNLPGDNDPMFRDIMEKMVRQRLEQLDHLPADVGGRIRDLREYDFMEPEARQQFEELLQMLQQQMMQSYFQGLQQSLQQMTPESMQQMRQMIHDLNQMMEARKNGEDPDFENFMKKWGQNFPDGIKDLDQLLDHLQQQMGQMQSLLNSMSPEMRQQLEDMVDSIFQDQQFQQEMANLGRNLQQLRPGFGQQEYDVNGDEPVSLQEAMKLMGDLNSMGELEQELLQSIRSNNTSDIDTDEVGRLLGEEARQMAEQLQQMTRMLEEAGLIQRRGKDWELTPRAIRKIGERALQDIFGRMAQNSIGDHALDRRGFGVERLDETKPYVFGDQFFIDSQRSVLNSLLREGPGTPVKMKIDDFEVYRTETLTQCSTVIMLDMSYSMMQGGRFQAGRKVAMALDSLIRSKFPKDNLWVVAFSYFVLTLRPEMLLDSYWVEYGGGTNVQEALRQARLLLSKCSGTKQIILITDGQPTTFTSAAQTEDSWERSAFRRAPRAMEETLREVVRCTKDKITINTFMMERQRGSSEFVRTMARLNQGRAFFASPDEIGEYILLDYVNNKRRMVR
ncbi:MAG: VWA domain-containing protein [Chloroflexi bacterium]|nr:VWA domain-containing protein [Chloroflexota bacterium]